MDAKDAATLFGADTSAGGTAAGLADKVAFLSQPGSYSPRVAAVTPRETHMSWVFITPERVYKLKKPVRLPYLDFSTIGRRQAACRAETELNRVLAPDVYLGVVPLVQRDAGLALGGAGETVDWLVIMRRLDEALTMERALIERRLREDRLRALASLLGLFYRRARRIGMPPHGHLAQWRRAIACNAQVLSRPGLPVSRGLLARILSVQYRFLRLRPHLLAERLRAPGLRGCHGDLRPEHIWLSDPVKIIDRLEFNPALRALDPYDEIAFLDLECERLGDPRSGILLRRLMHQHLHPAAPEPLYLFYRSQRATLRARLAIAHLLEPNPRTPEKWPRMAAAYLTIAARDAIRLERHLSRREGR